ncbi:MAG: hypothetical protein COU42_00910 [Candidatus Nealsonbacteria bacterium CG10_big_fil_rev_8_21_14_0_10_36_24]|uniref:Peptidoglycan binding-like domain-containing protein n=2 Tax=Candidatus Nealsoniibacteriota TaxID=1817911 RepID=A0A2H0YMZ5_9BACT|nr:MAG: hypothetical protein COU42_00910 [Candidatus Nealsonbacteria bacterium CG10_big_fil_rev_8_21_14_0_10_36_24]PIS39858.1 MAG: hypothetical protein COT32_02860 [Candidatus Nealsonbacteria bacterium CG08_land_8_20_14_0_20_36_22]
MKRIILFIGLVVLFLCIATSVAADVVGERRTFFVDQSYDFSGRKEITAILVKAFPKLYFYIDEDWWNFNPQSEIRQALDNLEQEFNQNIYPTIINIFGSEWNPGIDNKSQITVLIHPMKETSGGYFRSNDEYFRIQVSDSNEREMFYFNTKYITTPLAKSFLAHELVHLITFNQKEKIYNATEEIWLNEARAEYVPTLLGYDEILDGSNLERRIRDFFENPSDPLIDWQNEKADYGVVNLFTQYLVDHYGINVLADALRSSETGIESLNYALEKNNFKEDFSQIFTDWTITVLINDCNYGPKYCYLNKNLRTFHITPRINFLPLSGESTLTLTDLTKQWSGNWYKIIGGRGTLKFSFFGNPDTAFKIPYITINQAGSYNVKFLELDKDRKGEVRMENFGTEITGMVIIPSLSDQIESSDVSSYYFFSWTASIERSDEDELIKQFLAQIEALKKEIIRVQAQIQAILSQKGQFSCSQLNSNLYLGLKNNQEVRCLQQFLKLQGPEIYPEGLVSGNFLSLTKSAVIRFQEKYASEILTPLGLTSGTGFVGSVTRAKINQLLSP